jgi:hypothetical protein
MLHAKAMAVVVAYDMYQEVCEGGLDSTWKVEKPMDFFEFRERLSQQLLEYNPRLCRYPGDKNMRKVTQQRKEGRATDTATPSNAPRRRGRPPAAVSPPTVGPTRVTMAMISDASKVSPSGQQPRLCGDLDMLTIHANSIEVGRKHAKKCAVCGMDAYAECKICGVALHPPNGTRGASAGKPCFYEYHNTSFFGLAKSDYALTGKRKVDWKEPTDAQKRNHSSFIKNLKAQEDNNSS